MKYYYSVANKPLGPISLEELHALYQSGVITLETLVVPEGGNEWKAYATLNPPPKAAGSPVPPAIESTPISTSAADAPLPAAAMPAAAPAIPSHATPIPQPGYKNLVLISWILLGATALLSIIPLVGCFSWVMFVPVFITTVILGFVTLSRGGTRDGVLILIASIVVLPAFTFIAPILTTTLFGKITGSVKERTSTRSTLATPAVSRVSPSPAAEHGLAAQRSSDIPDEAFALEMIHGTMVSFKNAVNAADFEPFYRTELSALWKKQTTPEKLKASFQSFIDKKIDLAGIFSVEPELDEPAHIDSDGLLILKGHYPVESEKVNVTYELSYSREAKWGLSGINVKIKPVSE